MREHALQSTYQSTFNRLVADEVLAGLDEAEMELQEQARNRAIAACIKQAHAHRVCIHTTAAIFNRLTRMLAREVPKVDLGKVFVLTPSPRRT